MAFRGSTPRAISPKKITSWSFSRWKTYQQCPYKAKLQFIDRLKEPESPQQAEGQRIHKLSEDWIRGLLPEFPHELEKFKEEYQQLRQEYTNDGVFAEQEWALTEDLSPCGWFDRIAWLRVKLDIFVDNKDGSAVVVDLKTGKPRQEDEDQLSLFALGTFLIREDIQIVKAELWYSATGDVSSVDYQRKSLEVLKKIWSQRSSPMLNDTEFRPKPNHLCKWCHFRSENGGPCTF